MELKIWVDGIQRIVCGVKGTTTCQDVVFALAHACGKLGRFTLIERWRNNERLLSPNENPLKILLNWGEYANDVQFILKTTEQPKIESESEESTANSTKNSCIENKYIPPVNISIIDEHKHINSSLVVDNKPLENIGIVKGVQQKHISENVTIPEIGININKNNKLSTDFKAKDGKKRDYKINIPQDTNCVMNENILNAFNYDEIVNNNELLKSTPLISSNGALVPPPYREPPPPRSSPVQNNCDFNDSKFDLKDCANIISSLNFTKSDELNEYKDLFQLIKLQREKLSSQQADISKCDAEIIYLRNKESDKNQVYDVVTREMNKASQLCHLGNEQLRALQYVEEENELVRQQEKTLKSEITLLRSKLANCETELLQCKNKIRMLLDDIQIEQRTMDCKDNRQLMERNFMVEVERIQAEIDQAIHNTELSCKTTEDLQKEIILIENNISEKKRQVEQLVNDMKEINLQSLAVTTSDEIRNILEGPSKLSSSRRIIGSPRQLENAVPTSKNPHGVWV